jgi:hypothetical protein
MPGPGSCDRLPALRLEGGARLLYQFDARQITLPRWREVAFRGGRFHVGETDGLSCVAWRSGAMSFVMVSGARPEHLLHLACHATGMPESS